MGMAAAESQFHVLAVDDSLVDRKIIERLLRTSFQVTTVDSGSKALEFLGCHEDDRSNPNSLSISPNNHQEVEVDLIITDYCMPGMTGYDLLKQVKESSSLRNIPVVIMSSENDPSRITRCLEEGAEEFFLKPVRESDLNKLRQHMMKSKNLKDQKQEDPEEQQQPQQLQQVAADLEKPETQSLQQLQQEQLQQQLQQQSNNNKRKAMEESLPQDRTRPRYEYDGLTAVV